MNKEKTPFPKPKKYKSPDGTIRHIWDDKLHSWDFPALIPQGEYRKRQYFIYGIEYSEEDWKERKRQQTGIPFYKNPAFKQRQ